MYWLIYSSLLVLALGVLTSISLLALHHFFIFLPCIYFLVKTDFKKWMPSTWALLGFALVVVLSIIFNQDIMVEGYYPLKKSRYFFFGFLCVSPFGYFFYKIDREKKKISYLLYLLCISTTAATLYGVGNHISDIFSTTHLWRNGGFFGMMMNYAHNMTYFLIIIVGLLLYRREADKFINIPFLYLIAVINLIGFYLTYTRGAWIGLLSGIPFYFFKKNKKSFVVAIVGILVLGAVLYFSAGKSMYRKDKDESRIGQWQAAVYAFKERPLLGVGFLNFGPVSSQIKKKYSLLSPDFSGHAHNNFFEVLGSTGAIGFIFYLAWLGLWFKEMMDRDDLIARIGLPFIITFVMGGLTQSTISLGINLFFVMGVYALTQANKSYLKTNA